MKFVLVIPLVCLVLVQAGCSSSGNGQDATRVLYENKNRKYGLSSQFHGHDVTLGDDKREAVVEYVSLQRERDGAQARFQPIDGVTLAESSGYFQQVWSPDEETLVLPLGRYDGFWITRSSEAFAKLTSGSSDDRIRVELKTGTQLWHEFRKWKAARCFEFTAGLSGQQVTFTYDLRARRLSTSEKLSVDFAAANASGPTAIEEDGDNQGPECNAPAG